MSKYLRSTQTYTALRIVVSSAVLILRPTRAMVAYHFYLVSSAVAINSCLVVSTSKHAYNIRQASPVKYLYCLLGCTSQSLVHSTVARLQLAKTSCDERHYIPSQHDYSFPQPHPSIRLGGEILLLQVRFAQEGGRATRPNVFY